MRKTLAQIPKNHVDKKQFLDYYLTKEVIQELPQGYAARVANHLLSHSYKISSSTIYSRAKNLIHGNSILKPAADMNGHPTTRNGKDRCYEGFWSLMDVLLPNRNSRRYIGLAANQIDVVRKRVDSGTHPIVVCENIHKRLENLQLLANFINRTRSKPKIKLIDCNIFQYLESKKDQYNIFDLDLMCNLPSYITLDKWVQIIYDAAHHGINLIYLAVCIGRSITEQEHNSRAEYLYKALQHIGFQKVGRSRFAYRDRQIPMRGERLVLTK